MRIYYHSTLISRELERDRSFCTIPDLAKLEIKAEKNEQAFSIALNGKVVPWDGNRLDIAPEVVIKVCVNDKCDEYAVKPSVSPLSCERAAPYETFENEYLLTQTNVLEGIRQGNLKMYAIDQSIKISDWSPVLGEISSAYNKFKKICEKPKTHLKASNEVRPIETVKRVGHESIPYLASHSEDWLARTASGLKPARLFSRVEETEYQIYENRVVKTLIDLILSFLKKLDKQLEAQEGQLYAIMGSGVQTGSFGFDASFQRAVSEMIAASAVDANQCGESLNKVRNYRKEARELLKKYRHLKHEQLYRHLKKAKPVSDPLNETNILTMDKHYKVVYKLWKSIYRKIAPKKAANEQEVDWRKAKNGYNAFCKTLCGYAAHVLGFEAVGEDHYFRAADSLEISIKETDGFLCLAVKDKEKRYLVVENGLQVPIPLNGAFRSFEYDGKTLRWNNEVSDSEIEEFCSLFKTRESRGREQAEEQQKYKALKQAIDNRQRECRTCVTRKILFYPAFVELTGRDRATFKEEMIAYADRHVKEKKCDFAVISLPLCEENEQKIVEYAKNQGETVLFLPLTMFDINSYRRVQNILLRAIVSIEKDACPACGGIMRERNEQKICDNCNQLILTKTICANSKCKNVYRYLSYDVSEEMLMKMRNIEKDNFYQHDSLYQYKDIVQMSVESGRIRAICPCCKQ